ncbi:MAG: chemotaxis protein CheX [Treponema sp.]|jgi:chemotaxis protein CheX|nr:chemotaxis protein CheX [Treponema sp.]
MEPLEQLIKPFLDVTLNAFQSFVGCELSPRHPYFADPESDFKADISGVTGVIGLSGVIRGAVIVSMSKSTAIKVTDMLIGEPHTELDGDVVDAIGEIVNIIAGNIKQKIAEGDGIVISLPTVIKGKEHSIVWPSNQERILCIPFKIFDNDVFHLMVTIERKDKI